MERRKFISNLCLGCAYITAGTALLTILEGCAPIPTLEVTAVNKLIRIPISSFIGKQNILLVKHLDSQYDILLVKNKDQSFHSLYMECSHLSTALTASKTGLYCPNHGSSFDLNGEAMTQPANTPLKKLFTETTNTEIIIHSNKFIQV